ncbi:MAG: hypothetical protein ACPHER_01570 [Nevskiales bacterium]
MKHNNYRKPAGLALCLAVLAIAGCNGDYSGGTAANQGASGGSAGDSGSGSTEFANTEVFFSERVEPRLGFCRTCHIPGGVADTDDGRGFMLSTNSGDDYANLYASWEALGRGVEANRILTKASDTDAEKHSAGLIWPVGGDAYNDVASLFSCWDNPVACVFNATGDVAEEFPLLGGVRGGNALSNFCEGQPDNAALPPDPRTLVVPGVNEGKAVAFNAYWRDCDNGVPRPTTCGELREQAALGYLVGEGQGMVGSTTAFSGGADDPGMLLPASSYNNLWRVWGLTQRPDNFDYLAGQRYGSPPSPVRNPYPLPGENPNETDGGSGQLPLAFTQVREDDGSWTGKIGVKACVQCHNGQLGTAADGPGLGTQLGGAGSIGDFTVAFYDFAKTGLFDPANAFDAISGFGPVAGLTIATNRGTGAIDFFQLAFILFSGGDPQQLMNEKILLSQAIGTIKSPPWWNMAYRTQKFHGAILPTDSSRIDMAAYYDLFGSFAGAEPIEWIDEVASPFQVWTETLPSPQYPGEIDTALAEQGAILFHSKDLWAEEGQTVARPDAGNGSCASCHGAYSPRYVNDPNYLDSPELAGIAAYTQPTSLIGTDPVYSEAMQSLKQSDGSVSPVIMDIDFLWCGLGNAGSRDTTPIMLAPPLWGTWANAPYFHNGSVPNVWGVLDPSSERPAIWERVSTPARPDQAGQVVMGYDTDLQRAYDHEKLGWKYEELSCGESGTLPFVDCDPVRAGQPGLVEEILGELYTNIAILWNLPRVDMLGMTNPQIEARKIYNTLEYSQGNQGHEFSSVLTDAERRAIIEYLKTL